MSKDRDQIDVAEHVVHRAAFYDQRQQRLLRDHTTRDLASISCRLTSQYHILRIALVC